MNPGGVGGDNREDEDIGALGISARDREGDEGKERERIHHLHLGLLLLYYWFWFFYENLKKYFLEEDFNHIIRHKINILYRFMNSYIKFYFKIYNFLITIKYIFKISL